METLYTIASIVMPIYGIWFLQKRIQAGDSKAWQSYAAFTALIVLCSLLFLVASGKVVGVDSSGKVEFVRVTAKEMKNLAKTVAEVIALHQDPIIEHPVVTLKRVRELRAKAEYLLITADISEAERKPILDELDQRIRRWEEYVKQNGDAPPITP